MRVIVQCKDYGETGGIARYVESFLNNLPKGVKVILITAKRDNLILQKNVQIIQIPYTESKINKLLWGYKARKKIKEIYRQGDRIIIHIPPLLPALFIDSKLPYILTAHTTSRGESGDFLEHVNFEQSRSWIERKLRYKIESYIFKKAFKIITLTQQGEKELISYGFFKSKIVVIPNGVDTSIFKPNKKIKKDIDVLFIGRLTIRKGSQSLVSLCNLLVKEKKDIQITVIGFGEDEEFVRSNLQEAIKNKNVKFVGKVPSNEVIEYYQRSKIYCSTSYYEGLPGTCLEAMACGLPVVVWNMDFYNGLVINNKTGYTIKKENFNEMTEKIKSLITSKQKYVLEKKTRRYIETNYNWKSIQNKIIEFLHENAE